MALRRPASSRAKPVVSNTNSTTQPQQRLQRSKSVMSRPTSSQRNGEDLDNPESAAEASNSKQPPKGPKDAMTNIQVILRCRGRSEREIDLNSPVIVEISDAKSKELTIETSAPTSSLGMITRPPTRTYPFDLVFGPDATQSMIYHDVVGPMLAEVILGYNCTLFAYGQTGTGKTYTMQGDLKPTPMGNPSAHAGIIPRTLFRLFHELEKSHTDFIVKISFIELYNEELRDLLAPDLSAPTNLLQPMGLASKDSKNSEQKLAIFDDSTKGGVFIQGLEEIAVKDSKDALALLTKGSERRQMAATNFNDHSSRSHSVFSITVHTKETTVHGDDLVKVGKLNLVDLAGSENIGRSGAENKRAREAGMINQSLLTLGRVINALVERASHVPYRESKLTRLLQDSLGGRTKTCIIATISPSRSNIEETLSTLDYAYRAKDIRNKPELNQRMTRNTLLKEYGIEIERLKADLIAAREKNGIYFSDETWAQLSAEKELRETELMEAKKQVTIIENQMRTVRDEYDQSIAVLKHREQELQETKGMLDRTKLQLRQREEDIIRITKAYEEEVIVRQAHQETEVVLNDVAVGLRGVAQDSVRDLSGVFDKLERKNNVFVSNKKVVSENEKLIKAFVDDLTKRLAELSRLLHTLSTSIHDETTGFQHAQQEAISDRVTQINGDFKRAHDLFKQIELQENGEEHILSGLKEEMEKAQRSFNDEVESWSQDFITTSLELSKEAITSTDGQMQTLEKSSKNIHSLLSSFCDNVHDYIKDESDSLSELQVLSQNAMSQELAHIQHQNEVLAQMLITERKEAAKAKDDLLQRVSGMLGEFMQKRDENLKSSVENLQRSNEEVQSLLNATYKRQSHLHGHLIATNGGLETGLQKTVESGLEANKAVSQSISSARTVIGSSIRDIHTSFTNEAMSHRSWVNQQTLSMKEASLSAFEEYTRVKRTRIDATEELANGIKENHTLEREFLSSTSNSVKEHVKQTTSSAKEQILVRKNFEDSAKTNIESIEKARSQIAHKGNRDDVPTGSTPRKRKWQYRDEWSLTRSRDELLKSSREEQQDGKSAVDDQPSDIPLEETSSCQMPSSLEEASKTGLAKVADIAVAPLVESRKRNVSNLRAPRRAR